MKKKHKGRNAKPKGLTLVEVLVGVLISSVVVIAILMFLSTSQKLFFNQGERADAMADSQLPGHWISRDIRGAIQVMSSHGGYTTSVDTLVLMLPAITSSEYLITGSFDYIIYRRNPDYPHLLERIIDAEDGVSARADNVRQIADDLNSITFLYYDADNLVTTDYSAAVSVNFIITSSKTSIHRGNQPFVETFNSWAKLRNKTS